MSTIISRILQSVKPKKSPYFIRDNKVKGFAIKVNPSGPIKFIVEVRSNGQTVHKTIGEYPQVNIKDAKLEAIVVREEIKRGGVTREPEQITLAELFDRYVTRVNLKPSTLKTYRKRAPST